MLAMPLFGWMKWPRVEAEPADTAVGLRPAGEGPYRTLMRELLRHVEERERLARGLEGEHWLAHSMLGYRWQQSYPSLQSLIPPSEHQQLEHLCTQIQPAHTAAVLSRLGQQVYGPVSGVGLDACLVMMAEEEVCFTAMVCKRAVRFRKVLATNNVLPWELVHVFKQVLKDFLNKEEEDDNDDYRGQLRPMETWASWYQIKQGFVTPAGPNCRDTQRDEIPTISSYVDRTMRGTHPYTLQREWDLPYYYTRPYQTPDTYSTTL